MKSLVVVTLVPLKKVNGSLSLASDIRVRELGSEGQAAVVEEDDTAVEEVVDVASVVGLL